MENILNDRNELDHRLYVFPNSALKLNDKKINYLDFLSNTKDPNCIEALRYVQRHYDQKKVDKILKEEGLLFSRPFFYGGDYLTYCKCNNTMKNGVIKRRKRL